MRLIWIRVVFFSLVLMLVGCVTPGNLEKDRLSLNEAFFPKRIEESLYIKFEETPGVVSARTSTMVASGGLFIPIEGQGSVNVTPISMEIAKEVFGLKYNDVTFIKPKESPKFYGLLIYAQAETESMYGGHTAKVQVRLKDHNNIQLYSGSSEVEVRAIRYAQEAPMRRAFYRAYHSILREMECYLEKVCAKEKELK